MHALFTVISHLSASIFALQHVGKHGLRQCTVPDQHDSALITSGACHGARAKNMPHVSLLEISCPFKGSDLAVVLLRFLLHASGKALMPDQYAEGKVCALQQNSSSLQAETMHPSLVFTTQHAFCNLGRLCRNYLYQAQHPSPWQQSQSLMTTARLSAIELNDTLPLHIME